jgi:hypothetical protein
VERPHGNRPAVGGGALADNPAAAFQAVEDAGDRRRMQPGAAGERRRAERTAPVQDLQAVQVRVVEVQVRDDLMVEQRELDVQLAQRLLDLRGEPPAAPGDFGAVLYFVLRMI